MSHVDVHASIVVGPSITQKKPFILILFCWLLLVTNLTSKNGNEFRYPKEVESFIQSCKIKFSFKSGTIDAWDEPRLTHELLYKVRCAFQHGNFTFLDVTPKEYCDKLHFQAV